MAKAAKRTQARAAVARRASSGRSSAAGATPLSARARKKEATLVNVRASDKRFDALERKFRELRGEVRMLSVDVRAIQKAFKQDAGDADAASSSGDSDK